MGDARHVCGDRARYESRMDEVREGTAGAVWRYPASCGNQRIPSEVDRMIGRRRCGCHVCGCRAVLAHDNALTICSACARHTRAGDDERPADFWTHPTMVEARKLRDMGAVCRAYRHHPYHSTGDGKPLKQEIVAERVGVSQVQVCRIENGTNRVRDIDKLVRWALALHMPASYAWFDLHGAPQDEIPEVGQARRAVEDPQSTEEAGTRHETKEVRRRALLVAGGAGLIGTGVAKRAPFPAVATTLSSDPRLAAAILTSNNAAIVTTPLANLAKRVRTAWRMRQCANYSGLAELLPLLVSDTECSSKAYDGEARIEAVRALVHTYNAASSLLRRLGDNPLALVAADRATRAAQDLTDPVLTAAALYRVANVQLGAHRLRDAIMVARTAAEMVEPGKVRTSRSLAVWGGLLLTAAVAAARDADESVAWELMGEARTASRLLGTEYADLYSIFGPTNVAIHAVQVAVELGNGRDAVQRGEQVDASRMPVSLIERRGQFLIDVARGQALVGAHSTAVSCLLEAEQVAPEEVRLSMDVRSLLGSLLSRERLNAAPGLRGLARRTGLIQ